MFPMFQQLYRRHKIICWAALGLILLYTVVGFVVTPLIVDYTLRNKVSRLLQRKVQADSVRTNPYTFSIRLRGLSVSDGENGRLLHIEDLYANADPLFSLFKWGVVIKSVEIHRPKVHISRLSDGRFNFTDMIPPQNKDAKPDETEPARPPRLVLKAFNMMEGVVRYTDMGQPQPFESTLSAVTIRLDRLDTQPEADAAGYRITARSEAGEILEVAGGLDVDPLDISAALRLDGLAVGKYAPYYQNHIHGKVTDGRIVCHSRNAVKRS